MATLAGSVLLIAPGAVSVQQPKVRVSAHTDTDRSEAWGFVELNHAGKEYVQPRKGDVVGVAAGLAGCQTAAIVAAPPHRQSAATRCGLCALVGASAFGCRYEFVKATFGGPLHCQYEPMKLASPLDLCSTPDTEASHGAILVAYRGNCSFADKAPRAPPAALRLLAAVPPSPAHLACTLPRLLRQWAAWCHRHPTGSLTRSAPPPPLSPQAWFAQSAGAHGVVMVNSDQSMPRLPGAYMVVPEDDPVIHIPMVAVRQARAAPPTVSTACPNPDYLGGSETVQCVCVFVQRAVTPVGCRPRGLRCTTSSSGRAAWSRPRSSPSTGRHRAHS